MKKLKELGTLHRWHIKPGRGLKISSPCVIILPADKRLRNVILGVIIPEDGKITGITVKDENGPRPR